MDRNLDEMIKSYSDELMDYARSHNSESLVIKNKPQESESSEEKEEAEEKEEKEEEKEEIMPEGDSSEEKEDNEAEDKPLTEIPAEEDMESFASFRGRVFTSFGAFPVENAKIILYRNDVLYAFLVTDKNGETARVKIEAFPEKNSLEPLSDEQSTEYRADVFAEGFITREGLLISAVGGSEIVLETELTPESEAIG